MEGTATASAAPTYGLTASLEYNGTAVQTTGLEFLDTMQIPITINNTIGVDLNAPKYINSALTLQTGYLDNSIYPITVGPSGSIIAIDGYLVTPLPVELTTFTASLKGNSTVLKWSTATEINNAGFQIERKLDGSNLWTSVAFIPGAGTSNVPISYSYEDKNLTPGVYVYRMKQIDNDGTTTIYNPDNLPKVDIGASNTLQLGNYPNPFNPSTEIRFSVPQDGYASLKVYNIIGQEVVTLFSGYAKAGHYIPVKFDASQMASGVYFSRLEYNGKSMMQKMLLAK